MGGKIVDFLRNNYCHLMEQLFSFNMVLFQLNHILLLKCVILQVHRQMYTGVLLIKCSDLCRFFPYSCVEMLLIFKQQTLTASISLCSLLCLSHLTSVSRQRGTTVIVLWTFTRVIITEEDN